MLEEIHTFRQNRNFETCTNTFLPHVIILCPIHLCTWGVCILYMCGPLCRPDLKVILMSATLNAELFSQYFGELSETWWPLTVYNIRVCFVFGCVSWSQVECPCTIFPVWCSRWPGSSWRMCSKWPGLCIWQLNIAKYNPDVPPPFVWVEGGCTLTYAGARLYNTSTRIKAVVNKHSNVAMWAKASLVRPRL